MLRALIAVSVASSALAQPTAVTVPAKVVAFAQDGGRVAWVGGNCEEVHVRVLATGREWTVGRDLFGDCQQFPVAVALGGARAIWTNSSGGLNNYVAVATAAPGERQHQVSGAYVSDFFGAGATVSALAADGSTLVYGVLKSVNRGACDDDGCESGPYALEAGWVMRVVGHSGRRLWKLPAAMKLAVAGDTLAIVRPAAGPHPSPSLASEAAVELWSVARGVRLSRIELDAPPAEIALDRTTLGVLVRVGGAARLERFSSPRGAPLGTQALAPGARDLSLSSTGAVYRTGRTIRLVGRARPLALAASSPIGLSIESTRVAWAENVGKTGRIRVLRLR